MNDSFREIVFIYHQVLRTIIMKGKERQLVEIDQSGVHVHSGQSLYKGQA